MSPLTPNTISKSTSTAPVTPRIPPFTTRYTLRCTLCQHQSTYSMHPCPRHGPTHIEYLHWRCLSCKQWQKASEGRRCYGCQAPLGMDCIMEWRKETWIERWWCLYARLILMVALGILGWLGLWVKGLGERVEGGWEKMWVTSWVW
ncbi:hypothetical protein EX30DRAFT_190911 [Ascodesmis nigricans]|uniref:Uncharacterized protein n=1 Tax=Ascodesmis nigricans TaxID=341454 RepID=A0A4S2N0F9_9PEZI|nr:hypothetical protein EX30DRAFT_190911 [Ascodesmis nigricans]